MKRFYLSFRILTVLLFLLPSMIHAQIWTEDFDGSNITNPFSMTTCDDTPSRDYLGIICSNGDGCPNEMNNDYDYFGSTGQFFGVRDMDNVCGGSLDETITATGIDVSSCSGASTLFLCFDIAESDATTNTDPTREAGDTWDANSFVNFSARFDGGITLPVISIAALGGGDTEPGIDSNCDGAADGNLLTATFQTFCVELPMIGNTLDLDINVGGLNTDGEDVAIDNIEVYCDAPATGTIVPSCTPFTASNVIFLENFDGANTANPFSMTTCDDTPSRDYLGIICSNGNGCPNEMNNDYVYNGSTGQFFGVRDMDNVCGGSLNETITATGINISSCSGANSLYLCFDIAESDAATNNDTNREANDTWDGNQGTPANNTFVNFAARVDGGSTFNVIGFGAFGNGDSGPGIDTDCDGVADASPLTETFQTFCVEILVTGNTLDLDVNVGGFNTDGDDVGIDNISVHCTDDVANLPAALSASCPPNTPPMAVCQNATAILDGTGNVTIEVSDVDGGSSDAEGIQSITIDPDTFDCTNIGNNTVILTITDNEGETDDCTAMVNVVDQTPPTVTCNDIDAQLDANGIATIVVADVLNTATDNCGVVAGGQLTQSTFTCGDAGTNMVTLTVVDVNGLSGSCQGTVTVIDDVAPVVSCQDVTVQLDASGNGTFTASDADNGSMDNCGSLIFTANPNTFDCTNVGPNLVTVTVTDGGGNPVDCAITVNVEDNVLPMAVCMNISIDLDANGEVSIVPSDVDNGSADACGLMLSVNQMDFNCENIGTNTVILTATDVNGNVSTCQAMVTANDVTAAVILCRPPVNAETDEGLCGAIFEILPPVVIEENCSITMVENDAPALYPLGTTTVMWTLTDAGNNETQCTQTVTVNDVQAPVAVCAQPFHAYLAPIDLDQPPFPFDNSCQFPSYLLDPIQSVTDNCGFGAMAVTNDAPQFFPPGQYTVTYTFTDASGNSGTCEQSVKVWDISAPELTSCPNDVVVEATDTNGANATWSLPTASDGCPQSAVTLIEANGYASGDFFPLGETVVAYELSDATGNATTCTFTVIVQPVDQMVAIAGMMATEEVATVEDVEVYINGGFNNMNMTLADGLYQFDVPMDGDYSITPQKDIDHLNGVTTYDLVLIKKHILGMETLDSPYKMIAADVNNSGQITTLDLVSLRRAILLIEDDFPNNTSWRFIDQDFTFADPTNPFATAFPEFININNLATNMMDADFVSVKIGDVNGNAVTNNLLSADDRTEGELLVFNANNVKMQAGETHTIDLTAADFNQFGFQFTLNVDNEKATFDNIESNLLNDNNFGLTKLDDGAITVSWNEVNAQKLADDASVLSLTLTAKTNTTLAEILTLNSRFTTAEAYGANGEIQGIELDFATNTTSAFQLYQNIPNPFTTETSIGFNLPADDKVTISIMDLSGKVVFETKINAVQGFNKVEITRADLPNNGILYYNVATSKEVATGKMVMID